MVDGIAGKLDSGTIVEGVSGARIGRLRFTEDAVYVVCFGDRLAVRTTRHRWRRGYRYGGYACGRHYADTPEKTPCAHD
jgi:hypothetical protein